MKTKLANLNVMGSVEPTFSNSIADESKNEETKTNGRSLLSIVKQLDNLNSKVRIRQSKRRLVDLTNRKISPSKQLEESRAKDVQLISEYEQVKGAVMNFVSDNYYGVLKQTDFGTTNFVNTTVKSLLFKP